jgi:hypothetical protein
VRSSCSWRTRSASASRSGRCAASRRLAAARASRGSAPPLRLSRPAGNRVTLLGRWLGISS